MFFGSLKSKASLLIAALKSKASLLIAALTASFSSMLPPAAAVEAQAAGVARPRGKNRALPRSRTKSWDGGYIHTDVDIPTRWGVPGAKLARKAAEGRIGIRK